MKVVQRRAAGRQPSVKFFHHQTPLAVAQAMQMHGDQFSRRIRTGERPINRDIDFLDHPAVFVMHEDRQKSGCEALMCRQTGRLVTVDGVLYRSLTANLEPD